MCHKAGLAQAQRFLIRDFLLKEGSSYPWAIYKHLKRTIERMEYHPPTYQSVRKMVYLLRKLGLIVPTRVVKKQFAKHYYKVVPGMEKHPAWRNPTDALYHPEKFREMTKFRKVTPTEWLAKIRKELRGKGEFSGSELEKVKW